MAQDVVQQTTLMKKGMKRRLPSKEINVLSAWMTTRASQEESSAVVSPYVLSGHILHHSVTPTNSI